MPNSFFLLSRFTLRVDNVLFRTFDTRIYHSFTSYPPLIVRETSGWEAPYDDIKLVCYSTMVTRFGPMIPNDLSSLQQLPSKTDLTPLTDPNFIAKALSVLTSAASQKYGAGTGWRGLGTQLEVSTLGQ